MAIVGTYLRVNDNSGLKTTKCIKIPKKPYSNKIEQGDYIIVSVAKGQLKKKFAYKRTCLGLVTSLKKRFLRFNNFYFKTGENRVILFATKEKTIGSRLYGPITLEAKQNNSVRMIKLAKCVL